MRAYSIVSTGSREKELREQTPMPLKIESEDSEVTVAELKKRLERDGKILYGSRLRFKLSPKGAVLDDTDQIPQAPAMIYADGPEPVLHMLVLALRKQLTLALPAGRAVVGTPAPGKSSGESSPGPPALPAGPAAVGTPTPGKNSGEPSPGPPGDSSLAFALTTRSSPAALMFPGQGSQYVKMLSGVQDLPEVQSMLAKARDILGWDVAELCAQGPQEKLTETIYAQPCLFCAGLAGVHKLAVVHKEVAASFSAVAGLSVGEYMALCVAGVFSFEDGLRLVKVRGEAMHEASTKVPQAMVSIAGLSNEVVEQLCEEARTDEADAVCGIANYLFPKGVACSGTRAAIQKLQGLAQGRQALQAKMLETAGAFHTSLMASAAAKLRAALDEALPRMSAPACDVYMNVTGEVLPAGTHPREICNLLAKQLTEPVKWEQCVGSMIRAGLTDFYEVGPMKQLKAMMKRIDKPSWDKTVNIEV
mmetsp:Transcript_14230/g.39210  ORF Transcript_14230/g.39210 Transcript_14230/m.39210 type:complete len:476 (+) Transcript_14230:95-1522(+)